LRHLVPSGVQAQLGAEDTFGLRAALGHRGLPAGCCNLFVELSQVVLCQRVAGIQLQRLQEAGFGFGHVGPLAHHHAEVVPCMLVRRSQLEGMAQGAFGRGEHPQAHVAVSELREKSPFVRCGRPGEQCVLQRRFQLAALGHDQGEAVMRFRKTWCADQRRAKERLGTGVVVRMEGQFGLQTEALDFSMFGLRVQPRQLAMRGVEAPQRDQLANVAGSDVAAAFAEEALGQLEQHVQGSARKVRASLACRTFDLRQRATAHPWFRCRSPAPR
jgi:hypothetical protein